MRCLPAPRVRGLAVVVADARLDLPQETAVEILLAVEPEGPGRTARLVGIVVKLADRPRARIGKHRIIREIIRRIAVTSVEIDHDLRRDAAGAHREERSEEHTAELQSRMRI